MLAAAYSTSCSGHMTQSSLSRRRDAPHWSQSLWLWSAAFELKGDITAGRMVAIAAVRGTIVIQGSHNYSKTVIWMVSTEPKF